MTMNLSQLRIERRKEEKKDKKSNSVDKQAPRILMFCFLQHCPVGYLMLLLLLLLLS